MTYDAFISYSHSADGELAPSLQKALQRLARPWYRVRALRVFRDETGLSVNPHLWASIEHALDESTYFVLLASPDSARSPWVAREIDHWIATKPVERILPVLTDGELIWDAQAGGYDLERSTALPPSLAHAFTEEPRHLDLRWAHTSTDLDLRNPGFLEATAALAAPMHGVSKDDLAGEDVRLHQRAIRLVWYAATLLLFLTVGAIVAASFAVTYAASAQSSEQQALAQQSAAQRNADEADRQRAIALENEQTATHERANAEASADQATANAAEASRQQTLAEQNATEASQNAAEAQANGDTAMQKSLEAEANAREARQNANAAAASAIAAEQSAAAAQLSAQAEAAQRAIAEQNAAEARAREADARAAAVDARSRALAATARNVLDSNGDRSLLLAVQARRFGPNVQTRDSLLRVLQGQPHNLTSYLDLASSADVNVRYTATGPDGRTVLGVSSNGSITLADAVTGARLATLPTPPEAVQGLPTAAEFSPDGSVLVVVDLAGALHLWEVAGSRPLAVPAGVPAGVEAAAVGPDGRSLAVAGSGAAQVLALDGGGPISPAMPLPAGFFPLRLTISPDGATLAVGGIGVDGVEHQVLQFDIASGVPSGPTLHGQRGGCLCVAEYRDILDLQFGSEGGRPSITSVAANVDDDTELTWDRTTGAVVRAVATPHPDDEDVVAVSPDHRLVATTSLSDADVRIRDLATGDLVVAPLPARESFCDASCVGGTPGRHSVTFLGSGEVLIVGADGIVRIFDPTEADPLLARTVAPGRPGSMAFASADGSVSATLERIGSGLDSTTRLTLVDTRTGTAFPSMIVPDEDRNHVALSDDGSMVLTLSQPGGDGTPLQLTLTEVATGAVRWTRPTDLVSVMGASFSPDGSRLAVVGTAQASFTLPQLVISDTGTGLELVRSAPVSGLPSAPTFIDHGRSVIIPMFGGEGARIERYDVATATFVARSTDPRVGRALALRPSVSADGSVAVIATFDDTILTIDTATLGVRAEIRLGRSPVSVALSSDGGTAVAAFAGQPVQLYDMASGQPLGAPLAQAATARSVAFADDGRTLVTFGIDAPLVRTDLDAGAWAELACSTVRRNLTLDEWNLLVGDQVAYEVTCPAFPHP